MSHQITFAHAEFAAKKKTTRRESFLARMDEVIPWANLLAAIEPYHPKGGNAVVRPSAWSGCSASISSSDGMT